VIAGRRSWCGRKGVGVDGNRCARGNILRGAGIVLRHRENFGVSGEPGTFELARSLGKEAMREGGSSGFGFGAAPVQARFYIVQVQHGFPARGCDLRNVWGAPGVFHEAEVIVFAGYGGLYVAVESGEAIDQWRDLAGKAHSIAQGARGKSAPV